MFLGVARSPLESIRHTRCSMTDVCCCRTRKRLSASAVTGDGMLRNLKYAQPSKQVEQFASRSGGEFVGFEAHFDGKTGAPIEVPERFVPQEYRDWNVRVYGLDENYTEATDNLTLFGKRQLIDVKVGCQEDAVSAEAMSFSIDLSRQDESSVFPSGCLSARLLPISSSSDRILLSLIFRDSRERRRIQVEFNALLTEELQPFGDKIVLRREMYDQPYNGGVQLIGCGGKVESFVSFERSLGAPQSSRLCVSKLERDISIDAIDGQTGNLYQRFRDVHFISLPANVSLRRYKTEEDNVLVYEAAAMINDLGTGPGPALVLARAYNARTGKHVGSDLFIEFPEN